MRKLITITLISFILNGCGTTKRLYMGEPIKKCLETNGKYYIETQKGSLIWVSYRDYKECLKVSKM